MPPTVYQRIIFQGIPYWKDAAGNLFYYESSLQPTQENAIKIGTETEGIYPDWTNRLEPLLVSYRASQKARARAPAPVKN